MKQHTSLENINKPIGLTEEAGAVGINIMSDSPSLFIGTEVELAEFPNKRHEEDMIGDVRITV